MAAIKNASREKVLFEAAIKSLRELQSYYAELHFRNPEHLAGKCLSLLKFVRVGK